MANPYHFNDYTVQIEHSGLLIKQGGLPNCYVRDLMNAPSRTLQTSISLVVEFQRWWVLKSKIFGQESRAENGPTSFIGEQY